MKFLILSYENLNSNKMEIDISFVSHFCFRVFFRLQIKTVKFSTLFENKISKIRFSLKNIFYCESNRIDDPKKFIEIKFYFLNAIGIF